MSFDLHANPANLAKEKFSTYRTYHKYLKLRVNTRDTWRFWLRILLFVDIETWAGLVRVQVVMAHDEGFGEFPVQFL